MPQDTLEAAADVSHSAARSALVWHWECPEYSPWESPRQCNVTDCGQQVDSIRVHGCILMHV